MIGADHTDLSNEIAVLRPAIYRLALLQLRDGAAAEDVTQDVLVAALEGQRSFKRHSSLRTWLFSILRFKVIDAIRDRSRNGPAIDPHLLARELDLAPFQAMFDERGCWTVSKDAWSDPHTNLERDDFFRVLDACMTKLPANTARVFLMREWLELEPQEVCANLTISPGNLRVLLYRARMQLRECLDQNWDRTT